MSKPEWCPQEVWDEADSISGSVGYQGPVKFSELVAHAILAAEKRGEEREREACAQVCVDYRYEHKFVGERYASAIRARSIP